jgi:hypothetical protein
VDIFLLSKKIIQKNDSFICWLLLVLSVDYLALFFVESILPGYVMLHLNLNFLLLFLLVGWFTFALLSGKKSLEKNQKTALKISGISFMAIFIIGTWFALYNIAFWELIVTFLLMSSVGYLIYKK